MNASLIPFLCCPVDRSLLRLADGDADRSGHIERGLLVSESGASYPIVGGVPDLTIGYSSHQERDTVETFGREWARYDDFEGAMGSGDLFQTFSGLTEEQIRGKRVLEVGCGGGRWLKVLSEWGAARVVGLEMSGSVTQAARRVAGLANVDVVRGSAMEMPFRPSFDVVVSIGVIHHLADPVLGIRNVGRVVTTGRHLFVFWVYAREGNQLYLSVVGPLRRITRLLPDTALAALSRTLAVVLWTHIRTVNALGLAMGVRLPLRDYLQMLAPLRLRDLESVVYDQLGPDIARYPTSAEVSAWVEEGGAALVRLHHRTSNSWQCHCTFRDAPG